MIFGLFETKRQRLVKLTEESLAKASTQLKEFQEMMAEDIIIWIIRCIDADSETLKNIGGEAMELRRSSMSHLGEEDTNWIRACIIESYVAAQVLGSEKVITMIIDWLRDNTPKEYKKYKKELSKV